MSSATTTTTAAKAPVVDRMPLKWVIQDAMAMTRRNLLKYVRVPTLLVFSTIQPVMFVILFAYVFGGAIGSQLPPAVNYKDYLMAGIFVQTVIFGSTQTGVALAEDLTRGMIDRFRSLPMARSAVLAGRTTGDTIRNLFVVLLMSGVGYLIGFRFHGGPLATVGAILLAVLFGLAFSWISANIGLRVRDVESAQAASFVWVFPLVFASSAFVPVETMPSWLQGFAEHNPISVVVDASRYLVLGGERATAIGMTGSMWSYVLPALLWIAGILLVFVPLAVRKYRRIT
jgi:ABC-2 type transport system permease protein/oleandomycin transport system permease protein